MSYNVFDHVGARCPKLGGEVTFAYCRVLADGLPCSRALVCFERKFPVAEFFARILTEESYQRCFAGDDLGRYERFLAAVSAARDRVEPED